MGRAPGEFLPPLRLYLRWVRFEGTAMTNPVRHHTSWPLGNAAAYPHREAIVVPVALDVRPRR